MRVMNFDGVGLSEWDSPNITGRTRKAVPFAEGAEQPGDVVHCPAGERHRHGAVPHAHLDQVSIVVARRLGQQGRSAGAVSNGQ